MGNISIFPSKKDKKIKKKLKGVGYHWVKSSLQKKHFTPVGTKKTKNLEVFLLQNAAEVKVCKQSL